MAEYGLEGSSKDGEVCFFNEIQNNINVGCEGGRWRGIFM